jgi:hypothetical protein
MIDFMDERKLTAKSETQEEFDEEPESRAETETTAVNFPIGLATRKRLEPKSFGHIYLGTPQRPRAIEALQASHPRLTPKNLLNFFKVELPLLNHPLPTNLNEQISTITQVLFITV